MKFMFVLTCFVSVFYNFSNFQKLLCLSLLGETLNYVLKQAKKHLLCLIIVNYNANADLPVRGLVTGWLWRVVQTKPILLSSLFCSRPGWN